MAGIFDIHALIALQNGWKRFSGRASDLVDQDAHGLLNFQRHFPMVEDAVVSSWFDALVKEDTVTFRSYASPGHDDFPLVVLQLMSEQSHTDVLGNAARPFEGDVPFKDRYVDSIVVNQEIELTIMTKAHELTRALFVVIKAILMRYTPMFLDAGYLDVKYLSSQELAPEERLVAEDAGIFMRKMRWRALAQFEAFPIQDSTPLTGKTWFVQSQDILTSNNPTPPPSRVLDTAGVAGGVSTYDD